ncbi:Oidioi.mRNA.OKI2018_I69.chr1.g1188.t1.cds [Oikopleura dioica]|uniref:Polypeptide N-acetylgalactosaminyltransferase n=1 Tax=Oikopleura dioica TaxID=34765 RepID=A0ABN7SM56_OIKDI|nr:Oidioi.mRNA.OKI2018_I69.chr1.g1188.t1.cds [Oikopleura dioica]
MSRQEFTWEEKENYAAKMSIQTYGFNMIVSDKIPLDRVPDDLRDQKCKHVDYPENLPEVSVIIVFFNEGWSTFLRTVHSVINQTPKKLLGEIILIDDGSTRNHLKEKLDEYIQRWNGLVKIHRNENREGLIRARSIGASLAIKEVLVFLDAHCEAEYNWLPPLLAPIARNDRIATVPIIDKIDANYFNFSAQGGTDDLGRAIGGWDWRLTWKRIPFQEKGEKKRLVSKIEPYPSPAMAGGLFAINRQYFKDLKFYDPGLEIWGGENFELSFKLWICGGELLFVPCSRVGHIYRDLEWNGNPPVFRPSSSVRNYRRVVETWFDDDWKKYFYADRPEAKNIEFGDISKQLEFRKNHCPHDFDWFMKEIAFGVALESPPPPMNKIWGAIQVRNTSQCLDANSGYEYTGKIETWNCNKLRPSQIFRLTENGKLRQRDLCVNSEIKLSDDCSENDAGWDFDETTGMVSFLFRFGDNKERKRCLKFRNITNSSGRVVFADCDADDKNQKFTFVNLFV